MESRLKETGGAAMYLCILHGYTAIEEPMHVRSQCLLLAKLVGKYNKERFSCVSSLHSYVSTYMVN